MTTTSVPVRAEHRTDTTWCLVAAHLPEAATAHDWAVRDRTGAVVTFQGVVRDHGPGREQVRAIDYEAYEPVALDRLVEVATAAGAAFPGLGPVALWHRTGLVELGAASVNVTVAAGHRGTAFDAARFCIDVLKATVPVWKVEHDGTGTHRADAGTAVPVSVAAAARTWLASHHGSDPGCRECA